MTPEFFRTLHLLEPYGVGNPEPVFAARAVQLAGPPRILKDKNVKLKIRAGEFNRAHLAAETEELSAAAVLATPRCHPDSAANRRSETPVDHSAALLRSESQELRTEDGQRRTKLKITFDALGWHMAERLQATNLLAGDTLDIAFTIAHNDHPEYAGLELSLRDFQIHRKNGQ